MSAPTLHLDRCEVDARSIRANLNRCQGWRISFRQATYRGDTGISIVGRDNRGRRVQMFGRTWSEALGLLLGAYADSLMQAAS